MYLDGTGLLKIREVCLNFGRGPKFSDKSILFKNYQTSWILASSPNSSLCSRKVALARAISAVLQFLVYQKASFTAESIMPMQCFCLGFFVTFVNMPGLPLQTAWVDRLQATSHLVSVNCTASKVWVPFTWFLSFLHYLTGLWFSISKWIYTVFTARVNICYLLMPISSL